MPQTEEIIAYQGVPGAYSHLSCTRVHPEMRAHACESFAEAMFMVERGDARLAMIPLENSTAGRVEEIYRLMPKTQLHIIAEHFEPVNHCLLAILGSHISDIKQVSSHPQALAQCDGNIRALGIEPVAALDTAGAAADLANSPDPHMGAIASSLAAELYGLEILRENFRDVEGNTTRFLILARESRMPALEPELTYMTSIMFTVRNIPAALYKALGGFATNGVNMLKLESYMVGGSFTATQFYADIEGHPDDPNVKLALEELAYFTDSIKILGVYPASPLRG